MSTRATIVSISETGEMEMEDAVSDDGEEDFMMAEPESEASTDTEEMQDFQLSDLSSIAVQGLFHAGTPTPVVTPPFPEVVVPQNGSNNETVTANDDVTATFMIEIPGLEPIPLPVTLSPGEPDLILTLPDEETIAVLHVLPGTGPPPEISTEELDTECL